MSRLVLAVAFFLAIHAGFITALQIKRLGGISNAFCHLQVDGQIYCAGYGGNAHLHRGSRRSGQVRGDNQYYYQLGDGTSMSNTVLVNVVGLETGVAQVSCGLKASCALLTTGAARCWGSNSYGALGDGTGSSSKVPVQVVGFETGGAVQIAMGEYHTCFLSTLGKVSCSGYTAYGQLGNGEDQFGGSYAPTPLIGLGLTNTFISVSCGDKHSCAVTTEGGVLCWGQNSYGQLGAGEEPYGNVLIPQQVSGMTSGAASVWLSGENSFVIMEDGTAMGFGYNDYGALGVGNSSIIYYPTVFAYGVGNIKELRGGEETTCILQMDDTVQCLGYNTNGQFGNGSVSARSFSLVTRLTVAQLPPTPSNTFPPTTLGPTRTPTKEPTLAPTKVPTLAPTLTPTKTPTLAPTQSPTNTPTTLTPTLLPTPSPTNTPTQPTPQPTRRPTRQGDTSIDGGGAMVTGSVAAVLMGMLLLI
ncbi:hypothetical protein BASA82_000113 [Batrachochytrium salamandrivorans]|nr:hypothetical protein BASA82_000113 [Batrachochytrium salamandrivorans]